MTRVPRKTTFRVLVMFIAGGTLATVTRFLTLPEASAAQVFPVVTNPADEPESPKAPVPSSAKDDVPIHGRFLNPKGRPLAGARVRLDRIMIPQKHNLDAHLDMVKNASPVIEIDFEREIDPTHVPGLITETRTDAEGRFKLTGIGRERLAKLSVAAPSVVDTTLTVMTRDGPGVSLSPRFGFFDITDAIYGADFTLQLNPGQTVKGRVIDRDSRNPIAGMLVSPLWTTTNLPSLYTRKSDVQGRFTVTGLDPEVLRPDKIQRGGNLQPNYHRLIVATASPGVPYQTAWVMANGDKEVVIECRRGIPFRLKIVDDEGRPVEALVSYVDIQPNAYVVHDEVDWPVSRAARRADGTYEGFVLPGPGAVLVQTWPALHYRRARVDPKAFFAPGRTDWPPRDRASAYGTLDSLTTSNGRNLGSLYRGWKIDQRDYTAIVLVNPPLNSGPLELSATVVRDRP